MNKKELILNLIGTLFLIYAIVAVINTSIISSPANALWFCYFGLFFLGISILFKKPSLIKAQLNILTIPLAIWTFDFITHLIQGHSLLHITDYFFQGLPLISQIITLQHLFTIPLGIISLKLIHKKPKKSLKVSYIQLVVIYLATILFTSPSENINWVYHTSISVKLPFYPLPWFLFMGTLVLVTNLILKKTLKV